MDKNERAIIVLMTLTIIFTIMGATFAYWNWNSTTEQKTNVTFTVGSSFSCSADGGGSLTSNDIQLAPAHCTNTTYAIKRTITVHPTITQNNINVYVDLWLKVNSIAPNLSASENFKYALTTSPTNCETGVVTIGSFYGASTNYEKELLHYKEYSQTTTETYYLWIWLDSAETNSNTMNQAFNFELGGNCTDQAPEYVYTANIYDFGDWNTNNNTLIWVGQPIPDGIDEYSSPAPVMNALLTARGGSGDYHIFLRHTKVNGIVMESDVGFVVTSAMVNDNPGMTAGTYYLRGVKANYNSQTSNYEVYESYYEENIVTLLKAFGSNYCQSNNNQYSCYIPDQLPSLYGNFDKSLIIPNTSTTSGVLAYAGNGCGCAVYIDGSSHCGIYEGIFDSW